MQCVLQGIRQTRRIIQDLHSFSIDGNNYNIRTIKVSTILTNQEISYIRTDILKISDEHVTLSIEIISAF